MNDKTWKGLQYFPIISAGILVLFMVLLRVRKEMLDEHTYETAILGVSILTLLSLWVYDYLRINQILRKETHR